MYWVSYSNASVIAVWVCTLYDVEMIHILNKLVYLNICLIVVHMLQTYNLDYLGEFIKRHQALLCN